MRGLTGLAPGARSFALQSHDKVRIPQSPSQAPATAPFRQGGHNGPGARSFASRSHDRRASGAICRSLPTRGKTEDLIRRFAPPSPCAGKALGGRLRAVRGRRPLQKGRRFLRRGGGLSPPGGKRSGNENRAANSYKITNSPHDFVLPPAGEDVSAADR